MALPGHCLSPLSQLTERTNDVPRPDMRVDLSATSMVRQGKKAVLLHNAGYNTPDGRQIIKDFTYEVWPGGRVGGWGRFWGAAGRGQGACALEGAPRSMGTALCRCRRGGLWRQS